MEINLSRLDPRGQLKTPTANLGRILGTSEVAQKSIPTEANLLH